MHINIKTWSKYQNEMQCKVLFFDLFTNGWKVLTDLIMFLVCLIKKKPTCMTFYAILVTVI